MNKSLLTATFFCGLLILFAFCDCDAQTGRNTTPGIGVKAGMNFANLTHSAGSEEEESIFIGLTGGLFARLIVSEDIYLQPEILFTGRGGRTEWTVQEVIYSKEYCLQYIDLPVMVLFPMGEKGFFEIGPYASYLVKASLITSPNLPNSGTVNLLNRDDFNNLDAGVAAGIGLEFNMLSISVRYNYGLTNVARSPMAESILDKGKNRFFQLTVGLRI